MTDDADPSHGWPWRLIYVLALLYAAFVVFQNVQALPWATPLQPEAGRLLWEADPTFHDGFVDVARVVPGGPLAKAGVVAGDRLRFDRRFDYMRHLRANEPTGFTLLHDGRTTHHKVIAQAAPANAPTDWAFVAYDMATTIAALFGAFIIWRSRNNATTLLLGMAMTGYGLLSALPELWESGANIFPFAMFVGIINFAATPILFYAFALRFYREQVGPTKTIESIIFCAYAVVMSASALISYSCFLTAQSLPIIGSGVVLQDLTVFAGLGLCVGYLTFGWRRSTARAQQRYALLLVAAAALFLAQLFDVVFSTAPPSESLELLHQLLNTVLAGLIAPALLTYAILRRKVFDLSFAVNRTLVYGVVSAILLAAFGLIEWAVDHFVPIQGREKNAVVDAAIAVGVFLTFHRVRDAVEHGVEGLFFRRWQQAEAALRRFVREAAFFTEVFALAQAFARELSRYAEGSQSAVFLADAEGYVLTAGELQGAQSALDANFPALVSARADLKPIEVRDGPLSGCLIAPMVNRNDVMGVAILGPKPSGLNYRPDEIELIAWAARQVGLDLSALRIEELEKERADLKSANAQLERLIRPGDVSPSRSPA